LATGCRTRPATPRRSARPEPKRCPQDESTPPAPRQRSAACDAPPSELVGRVLQEARRSLSRPYVFQPGAGNLPIVPWPLPEGESAAEMIPGADKIKGNVAGPPRPRGVRECPPAFSGIAPHAPHIGRAPEQHLDRLGSPRTGPPRPARGGAGRPATPAR